MNFNGPGGQTCKQYIKANQKRPFFGNKEYNKRKNDMDTHVKKQATDSQPSIEIHADIVRNSIDKLK
jgi:hypothetical protein